MVRPLCCAFWIVVPMLAAGPPEPSSGAQYRRLIIRNAVVVEGNGTPAAGPKDIVIEGDRIAAIIPRDAAGGTPRSSDPPADAEIDAHGRYVIPGLVNLHAHIQEERAGIAMPVDYCLKLWLACGITTIRDVGSNFEKTRQYRAQSAVGTLAAPRIFAYPMLGRAATAEAARARIRELKQNGADGVKFLGVYRDVMMAAVSEARAAGLRTAHHAGVEETNAWDDIHLGTTSIEHFYGVPDAAFDDGVQHFPPSYNYNNETDRFRYAGRLWREANPEKLGKVLQSMVDAGVAWDPTLAIYEASRDLQRAETQPWFGTYLHPALEEFFKPNPANHGSYFAGWTSTDETYWKENYRIWMAALRDFERRGGVIGTGEDAGFIYEMYGFGLLRELELHQEAGFPTLKVIQHATQNGARVLGRENEFGRVRAGWKADLLVVNGNPLEDLKTLKPVGVAGPGIEWTIKDGRPYRVAELMADVRAMVAKGRAEQAKAAGATAP
jgi:cytosine/adenosine deaminase-related metal-dependent hydrolase